MISLYKDTKGVQPVFTTVVPRYLEEQPKAERRGITSIDEF